jgi:hypothetical protein
MQLVPFRLFLWGKILCWFGLAKKNLGEKETRPHLLEFFI